MSGDRDASDHIVEDVMVSHLADGISAGIAAEAYCHDHFFGIELALRIEPGTARPAMGWNIHSK